MGSKWLYSCCFMDFSFQDLFNIARSIFVQLPSSFISKRFVVHTYSSIITTATWKKLCFNLSDGSDAHIINSLSITAQAFARFILISLSVDERLLPRYMNSSTNFWEPSLRVEMTPFFLLKHIYSIFFAFKRRPMRSDTFSKLCSKDLACVGLFARSAVSPV